MNHLKFEWLRMWRKKSFLLVFILGLIMSLANIYAQNNNLLMNPSDASTIQDYSNSVYEVVSPLIHPDEVSIDTRFEITPAQERVMEAMDEVEVLTDLSATGISYASRPGTSHDFIRLMQEAINEDGITLTEEDQGNLQYALTLSKHIDEYQASVNDSEHQGRLITWSVAEVSCTVGYLYFYY